MAACTHQNDTKPGHGPLHLICVQRGKQQPPAGVPKRALLLPPLRRLLCTAGPVGPHGPDLPPPTSGVGHHVCMPAILLLLLSCAELCSGAS